MMKFQLGNKKGKGASLSSLGYSEPRVKLGQSWHLIVHRRHPEPQKSKLKTLSTERSKGTYCTTNLSKTG